MKFRLIILSILILDFFTAATSFHQIPREYLGTWRLNGNNSKIVGTLEITSEGTFTYLILPNYKRTGKVVSANDGIDLITEVGEVFRAIVKVQGNVMDICIGAANGTRPINFKSDSQQGIIYWIGNK